MLFSRLNRYIFLQSAFGIAVALVCVGLSIALVDLVEQMRTVSGVPGTSILTALGFTIVRLPGLIEQSIPITVLIGTVICFSGLSRRSEITALRAAGVSAWRFLAPLGFLSAAIGIFVVLGLEPISASLNEGYEREKARITGSLETQGPGKTNIGWTSIPSKAGQIVINGIKLRESNAYNNATILEFASDGASFIRRLDAQSIVVQKDNLVATNVVENKTGAAAVFIPQVLIPIESENLNLTTKDPRTVSLWGLPAMAKNAKSAGGSPERFWLRFYKLIGLPFIMLAMALFAAIMCLGLERAGGKVRSIFIAISVGILMYFVSDMVGILAISGAIPSIIAGLAPPIFVLSLSLAFLSYREDGK